MTEEQIDNKNLNQRNVFDDLDDILIEHLISMVDASKDFKWPNESEREIFLNQTFQKVRKRYLAGIQKKITNAIDNNYNSGFDLYDHDQLKKDLDEIIGIVEPKFTISDQMQGEQIKIARKRKKKHRKDFGKEIETIVKEVLNAEGPVKQNTIAKKLNVSPSVISDRFSNLNFLKRLRQGLLNKRDQGNLKESQENILSHYLLGIESSIQRLLSNSGKQSKEKPLSPVNDKQNVEGFSNPSLEQRAASNQVDIQTEKEKLDDHFDNIDLGNDYYKCLNPKCGKEFHYKNSIPYEEMIEKANTNFDLVENLVCSEKCFESMIEQKRNQNDDN